MSCYLNILIIYIILCTGCQEYCISEKSGTENMATNDILEGSIPVTIEWINQTVYQVKQGSTIEQVSAIFGGPPYHVVFDKDTTGSAFWRFYIVGSRIEGIPQYQIYEGEFIIGKFKRGSIIPNG